MTAHQTMASFALLTTAALVAPVATADNQHDNPPSEFEILTIIVERNDTDGDTEVVMVAKPDSDKGLKRLIVRSPYWRRIVDTSTPRRTGGLREFVFESPEPAGDAILAAYPEGPYSFSGRTPDGERFFGTAMLSHELPGAPIIISPAQDEIITGDSLTITWSQVPDAAQFIVEFENESVDPEQALVVNVAGDVNSFDVPASLLVPGSDLQIAIAAIGENGNVISTEVTFTTAD